MTTRAEIQARLAAATPEGMSWHGCLGHAAVLMLEHAPTDLAWYDAELTKAMARVGRLEMLLTAACGELEAEVSQRYVGMEKYPSSMKKMAQDLSLVREAREALEDKP